MRNYSHFEENTGVEIFFTTTSWNLVYSYNPPLLTCSSTDNIYLNVFNLHLQEPKQETRIVKEYYDKKNNRGAQYTIKGTEETRELYDYKNGYSFKATMSKKCLWLFFWGTTGRGMGRRLVYALRISSSPLI